MIWGGGIETDKDTNTEKRNIYIHFFSEKWIIYLWAKCVSSFYINN